MKKVFTIIFLFLSSQTIAQILTNRLYLNIEIPGDSTYMVLVDSVYIDRLVMHNGAELRFGHDVSYIFIANAKVGKNCVLNAAGEDGVSGQHGQQERLKQGQDGKPGKTITVVANFKELTSLKILANGGRGGDGGDSRRRTWSVKAVPYTYGTNGGNGGNGADGGRIELFYHTRGFHPTFNRPSRHSIYLTVEGGTGGDFGFKDKWAHIGAIHGGLGGNGKRGDVIIKRIKRWRL